MKKTLPLSILLLAVSCTDKPKSNYGNGFIDRVIELAVENPQDRYIELPDLYDSPVQYIPEDKDDTSLLGNKLLGKNFKETGRRRNNYPMLEKEMLTITYVNPECACEVSKIYYETGYVGQYSRTERIKCMKLK